MRDALAVARVIAGDPFVPPLVVPRHPRHHLLRIALRNVLQEAYGGVSAQRDRLLPTVRDHDFFGMSRELEAGWSTHGPTTMAQANAREPHPIE
jgi:hypothetical protein